MLMRFKYEFTGSLAHFIGLFDWKRIKQRIRYVDYEYETIAIITEDLIEIHFSLN